MNKNKTITFNNQITPWEQYHLPDLAPIIDTDKLNNLDTLQSNYQTIKKKSNKYNNQNKTKNYKLNTIYKYHNQTLKIKHKQQQSINKVSINQTALLPLKISHIHQQFSQDLNKLHHKAKQAKNHKQQLLSILQKKSSPLIVNALQTKPFFSSPKKSKKNSKKQRAKSYDKITSNYNQLYILRSPRFMHKIEQNKSKLIINQQQQQVVFKSIKEFSQTKYQYPIKLPVVKMKAVFM